MEISSALLLATLTVVNASGTPVVSQTSNVLANSDQCPSAMRQVVEHNSLQNNIFSTKRSELKARKAGVTLVVTCEALKDKQ